MYVLLRNHDVREGVYAHLGLCLVRSYQLLVKQQLLRGHHKSPPALSEIPDIKHFQQCKNVQIPDLPIPWDGALCMRHSQGLYSSSWEVF